MFSELTMFTTAFGVLVILTNAFTELLKSMFKGLPVQITATIIAVILTMVAILTYTSIKNINIEWYYIVGGLLAGFFVSYTAQFGYDKAKEIMKLITGGKAKDEEKGD